MATNLLVKLPPLIRELSIRKDWFEERDRLLAQAREIERVSSKSDFERAGVVLSALTHSASVVETMRLKLAAPFLMAARTIKEAADSAKAPLEAARDALRAKLAAYADAERRRREAARRRAFALREAAEQEYASAQRCALEDFRSETVLFNPALPPAPPPKPASFPKAESVAVRARLTFEISNETQLPREFLSPDKAKLRAWLDLNRETLREQLKSDPSFTPVPGVVFKLSTEVLPR